MQLSIASIKVSWQTYEWVMSHVQQTSYSRQRMMARMNVSWHTYEWHDSFIRLQATYLAADVIFKAAQGCVMAHIWMSHVTHMNESCHNSGNVFSSRRNIQGSAWLLAVDRLRYGAAFACWLHVSSGCCWRRRGHRCTYMDVIYICVHVYIYIYLHVYMCMYMYTYICI